MNAGNPPAHNATTIPRTPAGRLVSIQVGAIAPLGPGKVRSGFVKHRVDGPVTVGTLGLPGDEQADLRVHGGPHKAVYSYPESHYARWREDYPEHTDTFVPGGVGENLTLAGMEEDGVCLGDIFRVGSALLQVSEPRQPCFKFALRFDDTRVVKAMLQNGRSGWYFRVLQPGELRAGDEIFLEERPNPAWTVARFNQALANKKGTPREDWEELATLPGLAPMWQTKAREALE